MRKGLAFILCTSILLLFLSSCSSKELTISLSKNPSSRAEVTLLESLYDDDFSITEESIQTIESVKNKLHQKCSLQINNNKASLKVGSTIYTLDNVANLYTLSIFGIDEGFDDLYLLADDFLYKFNKGACDCILSLIENGVMYYTESNYFRYDDGIVLLGKKGVGNSSEDGLLKLTLTGRSSDIEALNIAVVGLEESEESLWLTDSVILYNSRNANTVINISSFSYTDYELLIDIGKEDTYDIIVSSEEFASILLKTDYIEPIDIEALDNGYINTNILEASNGLFITPFYSLKCFECSKSDPLTEDSNITLEDLVNEGGHIIRHDYPNVLLGYAYDFIDQSTIDSNIIRSTLNYCVDNGSLPYEESISTYLQLQTGELRFLDYDIGSIFQYISIAESFEGDMALIGYDDSSKISYTSDMFIMSLDREHKKEETIISYLSAIISDEYQSLDSRLLTRKIPINNNILSGVISEASELYKETQFDFTSPNSPLLLFGQPVSFDYRIFSDSEHALISQDLDSIINDMMDGTHDITSESNNAYDFIDRQIISDPEALGEEFIGYINGTDSFYILDYGYYYVIYEEAQSVFDNTKSIDEVTNIIVDRLCTLKSEEE